MQVKVSSKSGFTLVEIMIVVAIIGLLAAIAIPNLVTARKKAQRQACISTLKAIEGAKANWALDNKKGDNDVPSDADLFGADKYIENKPTCPANGTYNIGAVKDKPTCSVEGHQL
ncbi:MAG TPA: prepilin-type N-terminal cleavage/methylation domain-containing protein [Verrucomicrobiae bacterium]|jgi:prepilin-type N-terminal cleavage/methylation domain-containing protein